jgi:hypothetical protein
MDEYRVESPTTGRPAAAQLSQGHRLRPGAAPDSCPKNETEAGTFEEDEIGPTPTSNQAAGATERPFKETVKT